MMKMQFFALVVTVTFRYERVPIWSTSKVSSVAAGESGGRITTNARANKINLLTKQERILRKFIFVITQNWSVHIRTMSQRERTNHAMGNRSAALPRLALCDGAAARHWRTQRPAGARRLRHFNS